MRSGLTYALIAAIVGVFLYQFAVDPNLVVWLQIYGPDVAAGQWWRLWSHAVTHQHPLHAFFNLTVIYQVGLFLEGGIGSLRLAVITVVSAVCASAFVLMLNFEAAAIGASGVGLAWIAAEFVLGSREHRRALVPSLALIAVLSFMPRIAWEAHLGGFVSGLAMAWALRRGDKAFALASAGCLVAGLALSAWAVSIGGVRLW